MSGGRAQVLVSCQSDTKCQVLTLKLWNQIVLRMHERRTLGMDDVCFAVYCELVMDNRISRLPNGCGGSAQWLLLVIIFGNNHSTC